MEEKRQLFANTLPFWRNLSDNEQLSLLEGSVKSFCPKGMVISRSEQGCKGIMIILSGQLRAYIQSEEGREVTLYRVREGDVCVMSSSCLMESLVFDVMIEAIDDTEFLTIPSTILSSIVKNKPQVELFLYKTASERFSDIMWTIQQILFMGADKRVAIFLWDEYCKNGAVIKMTHEEIARYIGSAREVVTKVLKYFVEENIVTLSRGKIQITDKDKLRTLI